MSLTKILKFYYWTILCPTKFNVLIVFLFKNIYGAIGRETKNNFNRKIFDDPRPPRKNLCLIFTKFNTYLAAVTRVNRFHTRDCSNTRAPTCSCAEKRPIEHFAETSSVHWWRTRVFSRRFKTII